MVRFEGSVISDFCFSDVLQERKLRAKQGNEKPEMWSFRALAAINAYFYNIVLFLNLNLNIDSRITENKNISS